MTNLSENIKKYFATRIIDLIEIIILIMLMFYGIYKFGQNTIVVIGLVIAVLIIFHFVQKYTNKIFEKWEVPELNISERKKYLLAGTYSSIVMAAVIYLIVFKWVYATLLLILFIAIIGFKEWRRWRDFKKELEESTEEIIKEVEEPVEEKKPEETIVEAEEEKID